MPDQLGTRLECPTAHKRTLILAAAEPDGVPAESALHQVAEPENVIAAVEAEGAKEPNGCGGAPVTLSTRRSMQATAPRSPARAP